MKILHGTWIPDAEADFIQRGNFYIWVESTELAELPASPATKGRASRKKTAADSVPEDMHAYALRADALKQFLYNDLAIKDDLLTNAVRRDDKTAILPKYFLLPTADRAALPSLELARYLETELPETFALQSWQIDCYKVTTNPATGSLRHDRVVNAIALLNDLHFIALNNLAEVQLGADLLFWYHYTRSFLQVIQKDQYIPALKYQELAIATSKGKQKTSAMAKNIAAKATAAKKASPKASARTLETSEASPATSNFAIYAGWQIVSEQYEADMQQYTDYMPFACVAGFSQPVSQPEFHDRETLLRHFSECLLHDLVTHTPVTAAFAGKLSESLLERCLAPNALNSPGKTAADLELYQQWQVWQQKIGRTQTDSSFYLCFQLQAPLKEEEPWQLEFQVAPKQDPALKLPLSTYWNMTPAKQKALQKQFGKNFEQDLLLNLGYAARIYNDLWQGLETEHPIGMSLNLDRAFDFLKESAWVLEDAGYKVIVPAWWTPAGRRRAKLRLKAVGKSFSAGSQKGKQSYFSLDRLVEYQYELAIGGESISAKEWEQLVKAKAPLVKFRGEWMELDRDKMQEMLQFWQQHQQVQPEMSLTEFMKLVASDDNLEVDRDSTLEEMLAQLNDKSRFEPIPNPPQLNGTLREYQRRGVSWLQYLENLGLNGCLADDMGLGKTIQVIARLVNERAEAKETPITKKPNRTTATKSAAKIAGKTSKTSKSKADEIEIAVADKTELKPTLLIAPTSVVGNWKKEVEKFAPHLRVTVHHGSDRAQDVETFKTSCLDRDLIVTSFTLVRKDENLFSEVPWHRVVIDEAQNIKNPKAAQTKAILKLKARHRLALTGTPVENRLLDLWSIFNFLNPGYLGKESQFKKSFEVPIQKNNDKMQAGVLKKLVEPFILRRVKTDRSIIKDLPDKIEQKIYTNLTKEQASLYEAVVRNIEGKLDDAEGIERKGLILSTLLQLKQICNHPMQFLHDASEFAPERSHKLSRLSEMVEEAIEAGESLLIFSQFTEIGDALTKHFKHVYHYNTYYIHGGTSRDKRERAIAEFQDPETEPSVFILSLKAGGVGITLTKANHVFHFDRWWNPAVEDQATDRAFRIGQKKNVFVHKFVTIGSLEERIDAMIEDKKKLAGAIVGADESWLTELDNDTFKKLIALNKDAIL
ncbi:DEAD/DEAH box helicase [Pseudanabaena sp. PCC 6802]|uniref:DEAD/DEAH box helicase n=1 Tax=Pseudanabaena sp. PCC 6802 TaxID=118173 RepID=UPI00034DD3EC|nr:DEAD/DEAH box helicase [Pseudanabaena sp. PCC 6802]